MNTRAKTPFLGFILVLASSLTTVSCAAKDGPSPKAVSGDKNYTYYCTGNAGDVTTRTAAGLLLAGGSTDVDDAFRWLIKKSGGGDIVILRASGNGDYDPYIAGLGKVDSVETIVVLNREASFSGFVLDKINKAEALFLGGGDQSDYLRYWKGTPLQEAIIKLAGRGVPVGGTSAGLAVLGEFCFTSMYDTIYSKEALPDPYHPRVFLERDFLTFDHMTGTITDSHFGARDRMGRLLVFMARIIKDGWAPAVKAIAVDEKTVVAVEGDGTAAVLGSGAAYFLRTGPAPEICKKGHPLTFRGIEAYRLTPGGSFDLKTWSGSGGRAYSLSASDGKVESSDGKIY